MTLLSAALVALAAYLAARALTPWAIRLAPHIGAVDIPRDGRRLHTHPIPRTGGLALFAAFLLCAVATGVPHGQLVALLWGSTLLLILGLLDDIFRLPAALKLSVQLIAAAVTLGNGVGGTLLPGTLSAPLRLCLGTVWLVTLINAHNMIDGLDGLAASIGAIEASALAIVLMLQGNGATATLALSFAGAYLGFLHDNRHPARVFMGDAGSQFLGLGLGVLSLQLDLPEAGKLRGLVPLLIFALPLSDLGFAVLRRLSHGQSPFAADRGHWHHRLIDAGLGQRRACMWLQLLCAVLATAGVLLCRERWWPFSVYTLLSAIAWVVLLRTLHSSRHSDSFQR